MTRTIIDADLTPWQVFSAIGRRGGAAPARVVFRRLDLPGVAALQFIDEDGLAAAERRVATAPEEELLQLLEAAEPVR